MQGQVLVFFHTAFLYFLKFKDSFLLCSFSGDQAFFPAKSQRSKVRKPPNVVSGALKISFFGPANGKLI